MRRLGDTLLKVALAIPLAYEAVFWASTGVGVIAERTTPLRLFATFGLIVTACLLALACVALIAGWRSRLIWIPVAVCCAGLAIADFYGAHAERWQFSAHQVVLAYAVVLALAVAFRGWPAKLTSAST